MKRLLSLLVMLVSFTCLWAQDVTVTDVITLQSFKDAGYSGSTGAYFNDATVTGSTGAEYKASEIDYADNGLYFYYLGEMISVTKSVGMIASVEMVGSAGVYDVLVSHVPITKDNYSTAENIGTINGTGTVTVNGDYEYAAIRVTGSKESPFTSLTFTWRGEDAPALADHITPPNLKEQNPEGNFSASGYTDRDNANATMQYKGESGADYYFTDVLSDGTNFWANGWNYPYPKGDFYNTSAPGYIKSIQFKHYGRAWDAITFYVSTEPITNDNKYAATAVLLSPVDGVIPEWVADQVCKYFYMDTAQEMFSDVCVTWTTEAPLIPAKTPEINCWADPVTPGSTVNISTETQNATLHLSVYVNDVLNAELSKDVEGSSTSFEMPGKAGDVVKVEVYATADELVQSETATATYTLEMPLAATPQLEGGWLSYVVPGQQVTFYSETEGVQITYKMSVKDWNNAENNWEGEEVTAPSPVTVIVPEQAKPGTTFILTATAIAEGYQQSNGMEEYINAISPKLEIPTFSLEDGTEVRAGTQVQVYRPSYATGIRYTINGGEVQTCEDWALTYDINEDVTITAWAYGPEPLEESDKVTCSYKLEKFEAWHDVIIPENFTDNFSDTTMKLNECTSDNTNIDYKYYGGFWPSEGSNCFYMQCRYSYQNGSIIYNTTPGQINRIKVDGANNWSSVYILFSDEAPITNVTETMANYDYAGPRLRVGGNGETVAAYGEWIDLKALGTVGGLDLSKAKYFAIYAFGQNVYVNRVVVEYDPAMFSSTINLSEKCTDGTNYYGTYSSTKPFVVADDITVSEISVADNKLVVTDYAPGAVVPANTGVMVSSTTSGDHKVVFAKEEGTSVLGEDNMLRPTGDAGITATEMADKDADCKYYRLTMHKGETLGYFYGAANGAAFDVAAHKAYLAVPAAVAAKVLGFVFDGGNVTGIDSVTDDNQSDGTHAVYNLQGQRVNGKLVKGVYIVNGKKMIIK